MVRLGFEVRFEVRLGSRLGFVVRVRFCGLGLGFVV